MAFARRLPQADLDPPAAGRELDGVREQVPDHLLQPVGVAEHRAGQPAEARRRAGCPWRRPPGATLSSAASMMRAQLDGLEVEPQLAGDDARDVEQVGDELGLGPGVALDGLQGAVAAASGPACRCAAPAPSRGWRSGACAARGRGWPGTRPSCGWPLRPGGGPPARAPAAGRAPARPISRTRISRFSSSLATDSSAVRCSTSVSSSSYIRLQGLVGLAPARPCAPRPCGAGPPSRWRYAPRAAAGRGRPPP